MSHFAHDCGTVAADKRAVNLGNRFWAFAGITLLLAGFAGYPGLVSAAGPMQAEFGQWGVETRYIAPTVAPGDDFYRHVNKGWLDTAKIPAGFPQDNSFVELYLRVEKQVRAIIDDLKKQPSAPGTPARQIADMHASFINMERRNALGSSMLQPELAAIRKAKNRRDMARRMGGIGYTSLVGVSVQSDSGNPGRYILTLKQSGLGLPGRDYYLKNEEPYIGLRAAYSDYIEGVLKRGGVPGPKKKAAAILAFETAIAGMQWSPAQTRDVVKNYHPMSVKALARYAPGFDWQAFFGEAGFGDVQEVDVNSDTAIKNMAALFAKTPVETLRAYTAYHFLDNHALRLSDEWVNASFDMFSRRLDGINEQRPLDVRAVQFLNDTMGEQLGKLYVERYFPPESKAEIDKLVKFLRLAFHERLAKVDWMDEGTRAEAMAKLDAITTKIGYPERWHDFSSMRISKDDLVGNVHQLQKWKRREARAKLDEPVRTWEWSISPQEINAYCSSDNEIVFPAGILQPPFFDPKADPAVNLGAIGMVIGHEMGHGFDDQGSRFDGTGALRNWWGDTARRNFEQRAKRLVAQYNRYSPLPGLNVNGQLTLGENIGDLGGMMIAWSAYQRLVATEYQGKAPVLDGYTGNQRFFLGFGQLWRSLFTDASLRQSTLSDVHPPGEFRVNGMLRNFGPWYDAFGVTPKNALYLAPDDRVSIW